MAETVRKPDPLAILPKFDLFDEDGRKEATKWLTGIHFGNEAAGQRLAAAALLDTERRWVKKDGYRLSDRLWIHKKTNRDAIDNALKQGIAQGTSAMDLADLLESYLHPDLRPKRTAKGRIKSGQPGKIVTTKPDPYGQGSFPARRLARTEITRSHGQGTIAAAQANRFATGLKWNLSGSHPETDNCDINAEHTDGATNNIPGVWPKGDLPRYPDHPHCLCYISQYIDPERRKNAVAELRADYGLDAPDGFELVPLRSGEVVADVTKFSEATAEDVTRILDDYRKTHPTIKYRSQAGTIQTSEQLIELGIMSPEQVMRNIRQYLPDASLPAKFTKPVPKAVKDTFDVPFEKLGRSEVKDYITDNLDIEILGDWHDMSRMAMNDIAEAFHDLRRAGYDIPKVLRVDQGYAGNAMASYNPALDQITIHASTDYWQNSFLNQKRLFENGFLSTSDPRHTVIHEYGHMLHYRGEALGLGENALNTWDYADNAIARRYSSTYGSSEPAEFVAESFTKQFITGESSPDEIALYKKLKGPEVKRVP